jgi:hypothetical protein
MSFFFGGSTTSCKLQKQLVKHQRPAPSSTGGSGTRRSHASSRRPESSFSRSSGGVAPQDYFHNDRSKRDWNEVHAPAGVSPTLRLDLNREPFEPADGQGKGGIAMTVIGSDVSRAFTDNDDYRRDRAEDPVSHNDSISQVSSNPSGQYRQPFPANHQPFLPPQRLPSDSGYGSAYTRSSGGDTYRQSAYGPPAGVAYAQSGYSQGPPPTDEESDSGPPYSDAQFAAILARRRKW